MDIKKLQQIELQYELEQFPDELEFQIITGTLPLLISAPHSVTHFREGKSKFGEFMTAAIAISLNELVGCSYITKRKNNFTDPNFDAQHPYKNEIIKFVQHNPTLFIIDLHIMSNKREANIEIGTGKGKNIFGQTELIAQLVQAFEAQQLQPIIIDELFTGGNPNTVSSTIARETNIPCIQIELNWRLLDTSNSNHKIQEVLLALKQFIERTVH